MRFTRTTISTDEWTNKSIGYRSGKIDALRREVGSSNLSSITLFLQTGSRQTDGGNFMKL